MLVIIKMGGVAELVASSTTVVEIGGLHPDAYFARGGSLNPSVSCVKVWLNSKMKHY
jgi:hypothetical protein